MVNSTLGSNIALAGIVVSILAHFGLVVQENEIVTAIAGIAVIYGWIHQYIVSKKIVKLAKSQGVTGIK